jgi:hypothetical protein
MDENPLGLDPEAHQRQVRRHAPARGEGLVEAGDLVRLVAAHRGQQADARPVRA